MLQSNNATRLIEELNVIRIPDEFNYSYLNPAPGFYTVTKRSNTDHFKSYAVAQVALLRNFPFIDQAELIEKICEYLAQQEHEYLRNQKKDETNH